MNFIRMTVIGFALCFAMAAARADIVVVVSDKSDVTTLSKNQLADIFLGKSARFPNGRLAVPIDQSEGAAAREEFYTRFIGKSAAQLKAHWSKIIFTGRGQPPRAASNSSDTKKLLHENPNAISYIEQSEVDATMRVVRTL
jgi:ABC-type phosphate transport system substrate-binding protein